jgi:hypothetical protein
LRRAGLQNLGAMSWRRLKNLRSLILTRQHHDSKVIQAIVQQIAGGFLD